MIWIGLDVHQRFSRMGCFDPATGEVHDLGSVSNEPSALEEALEELPSPKTIVLEAGRSSHYMGAVTTWRVCWSRWSRKCGSSIRER
jgi:hypothetical protein